MRVRLTPPNTVASCPLDVLNHASPSPVGIVLTGTGADGAAGLRRIGRRGGFTIVQDPATCERAGMPEAAIAARRPRRIVPVEEMPELLVGLCAAQGRAA